MALIPTWYSASTKQIAEKALQRGVLKYPGLCYIQDSKSIAWVTIDNTLEYVKGDKQITDVKCIGSNLMFFSGDKLLFSYDISMTDEDTKIEISKQDITTKKELEGAKLKVTDKDGKVIDEWTSGKQPHMIKNLTAGETYTLTEVIAPKNYKVAESIQFTVKDTGVAQKVVMYDELMPVVKKVKTGDNSQIAFYMILAGLSICILGVIYAKKKIKD